MRAPAIRGLYAVTDTALLDLGPALRGLYVLDGGVGGVLGHGPGVTATHLVGGGAGRPRADGREQWRSVMAVLTDQQRKFYETTLQVTRAEIGDLKDQIEEERRLCYVGMTRAQSRLLLTSAAAPANRSRPAAPL